MPRVTHVKKAQQRYDTKPVIDPATGVQKKTPVMKNGKQKTTKTGRPVFLRISEDDKSKPKPPYTCDYCRNPIEIGTPYKHITPKSGPYGGTKKTRHETCPTWQVWEYSNSMGAQLAQISHGFSNAVDNAESPDEVQDALNDAAESVREIAETKREGASNIEEGFGHATSMSEELESMADSLDEWATEIESADVPDVPDCEECTDGQKECETCNGSGQIESEIRDDPDSEIGGPEEVDCPDCSGSGEVECDNCDGTGEDLVQFRENVIDEVTVIDESPV